LILLNVKGPTWLLEQSWRIKVAILPYFGYQGWMSWVKRGESWKPCCLPSTHEKSLFSSIFLLDILTLLVAHGVFNLRNQFIIGKMIHSQIWPWILVASLLMFMYLLVKKIAKRILPFRSGKCRLIMKLIIHLA